jgi:hypothetical protein
MKEYLTFYSNIIIHIFAVFVGESSRTSKEGFILPVKALQVSKQMPPVVGSNFDSDIDSLSSGLVIKKIPAIVKSSQNKVIDNEPHISGGSVEFPLENPVTAQEKKQSINVATRSSVVEGFEPKHDSKATDVSYVQPFLLQIRFM